MQSWSDTKAQLLRALSDRTLLAITDSLLRSRTNVTLQTLQERLRKDYGITRSILELEVCLQKLVSAGLIKQRDSTNWGLCSDISSELLYEIMEDAFKAKVSKVLSNRIRVTILRVALDLNKPKIKLIELRRRLLALGFDLKPEALDHHMNLLKSVNLFTHDKAPASEEERWVPQIELFPTILSAYYEIDNVFLADSLFKELSTQPHLRTKDRLRRLLELNLWKHLTEDRCEAVIGWMADCHMDSQENNL